MRLFVKPAAHAQTPRSAARARAAAGLRDGRIYAARRAEALRKLRRVKRSRSGFRASAEITFRSVNSAAER